MTLPLMAVAIAVPYNQSLRASGLCERGNRLNITSVIARRAKPDEAISFMVLCHCEAMTLSLMAVAISVFEEARLLRRHKVNASS